MNFHSLSRNNLERIQKNAPAFVRLDYFRTMKEDEKKFNTLIRENKEKIRKIVKRKLKPLVPKFSTQNFEINTVGDQEKVIYYYNNDSAENVKRCVAERNKYFPKFPERNCYLSVDNEPNKFNEEISKEGQEIDDLTKPFNIKCFSPKQRIPISIKKNQPFRFHKTVKDFNSYKSMNNINENESRYKKSKVNLKDVIINRQANGSYGLKVNGIKNYQMKINISILSKAKKLKDISNHKRNKSETFYYHSNELTSFEEPEPQFIISSNQYYNEIKRKKQRDKIQLI